MHALAFILYLLIAIAVFMWFQHKDHSSLSADTSMPWTLELLIAIFWPPALVFLLLGMGWNALRMLHDAFFQPKSP